MKCKQGGPRGIKPHRGFLAKWNLQWGKRWLWISQVILTSFWGVAHWVISLGIHWNYEIPLGFKGEILLDIRVWDLLVHEYLRQFLIPGEGVTLNLYFLCIFMQEIKGAISKNRSCVNFIAINQEKRKTHGEKEQYVPGRTVNHAEWKDIPIELPAKHVYSPASSKVTFRI